jgi:hypothetical protein
MPAETTATTNIHPSCGITTVAKCTWVLAEIHPHVQVETRVYQELRHCTLYSVRNTQVACLSLVKFTLFCLNLPEGAVILLIFMWGKKLKSDFSTNYMDCVAMSLQSTF